MPTKLNKWLKGGRKPQTRRWRCQAKRDGKRCESRALIESRRDVGTASFKVPVTLKLCSSCDREFSVLLGGQFDARAST